MFENIDMNDFWDDQEENEEFSPEPFQEETLKDTEKELGVKLPEAYVALMRTQNGGCPKNTRAGDTWGEIGRIFGIGKEIMEEYTLWTEDIGYPKEFVPVCNSAFDNDRVFLDYRKCGNDGEPRVVGIDSEMDTISFIAKDFESFINMLAPADYDDDDDDGDKPFREETDPYEGVTFTPVEGEQRKKLDRAIRENLLLAIGFTAFWLLVLLVLGFFKRVSFIIALIWVLSNFPAAYGLLVTIVCIADSISKSKQTYESYVDTVDVVWEANEPVFKDKYSTKKKIFLRLKQSKEETYRNTDGFKEGDKVRVYRPKGKKGEIILVKEQE